MIEEIVSVGPLVVTPYGLLVAIAFLVAGRQLARAMRQLGAGDEADAEVLTLTAVGAGLLGAKLYYAALHGDASLLLSLGGLVWYGGFLGACVALAVVIHRRRLPLRATADALGVSLALGYGIGRVGCFLVGDDYGKPTELPWGVAFPVGLPPSTAGNLREAFGVAVPSGVPDHELLAVHPTQLYETAAALLIWVLALRLLRRTAGGHQGARLPVGTTALFCAASLAVERFLVELLRAKDDRYFGPFTLAQGISLAILVAVAGAPLLVRRRGRRTEARRLVLLPLGLAALWGAACAEPVTAKETSSALHALEEKHRPRIQDDLGR